MIDICHDFESEGSDGIILMKPWHPIVEIRRHLLTQVLQHNLPRRKLDILYIFKVLTQFIPINLVFTTLIHF